ncbi:T6SS phospholipase effector Tle1-like catalytic domain-containing protein [Pseudomonas chlororaphis]|uniref:T6SS phospholipase effector Tle1-like catalytic domain-containing protein n=1 Tax=Pseudomonas chlororaphis TaxID=587753 RepID=UPI000F5598DF|nr:DUF2235 domain-containing protein [Pseudomonas chlororaphis]AZD51600.1 hypothetical protein C4K20_6230 [Pseudomonas chlororaphis subsp. aurantiaca]
MSESLKRKAPSPDPALIAPKFPMEGLLCMDSKSVSKNIQLQRADEIAFGNQHRKLLQARGEADSGTPCCKTLHITLAFDGTNNNDEADSSSNPPSCSNIARIFHASLGREDAAQQQGFLSYYCPGVGTVFPDVDEFQPSQGGLIGAGGGENRINWGLTRLLDSLKRTIDKNTLDVDETKLLLKKMATNWYGHILSAGLLENGEKKREEALRPILNVYEEKLKQRQEAKEKPYILAMRLYVYGFSRGAAEARTFINWLQTLTRCNGADGSVEYRFAGLPISVNFLGICDTVAAVGIADSTPFAAGHMDWADGTMRLPDDPASCKNTSLPEDCHFLKRCVHLVSAHEQRASFPLDSIRRRPKLPNGRRDSEQASGYRDGTFEFLYPGVHSDVGGGYSPGDQGKAVAGTELLLSQIPLHHLYAEAFNAGAPLQVPKTSLKEDIHEGWRAMSRKVENEFDFSTTLIRRFNAWQAQAKGGTLEEMMKREQGLITGWRIDRYAGGLKQRAFFSKVKEDMTETERETWKRIHKRRSADSAATLQKKPPLIYSEKQEAEHKADIESVGGIEKVKKMHLQKDFDPQLDQRQLLNAAAEFRHDYLQEWGAVEDGFTVAGVVDMLLGGTVFLINEEDEAEEYAYLYQEGNTQYQGMFGAPDKPRVGKEDLVALFDDHIHDSRAWFMNSDPMMGPREPFTDYFRIRLVHFDNESNKKLSLLAKAGRVIGIGLAVASVGLSIKKKDPRMLLGLFLPSLARPVLAGKVGVPDLPEISAFDPLTGIALPMMSNLDSLRAFTKAPGDLTAKVAALPPLLPLNEATANTPALQKILVAHQALEAVEAARNKDAGSLAGMLAKAANDEDKPGGWKDMLANQVGNLKSSEKKV